MEVHAAPAVGKRMWSYVRAAFFMMRKGVLSNKRKLLLAMHLRNKALARTLATLLSSQSHGALRRRDYEFSCANTPAASSSRRRLAYFPCLGAAVAHDDYDYEHGGSLSLPDAPPPLARIDYYAAAASPAPSSPAGLLDLAPGEAAESESDEFVARASASASPALLVPPPGADGRFSVRVSNYSSEDEAGGGSEAVDDDAEEFIRRFYDQLRRQNTIAMLPYMQHEPISAA